MAGVPLVVTPKSLDFLAPIGCSQRRQIALLNLSDQDVIYRIHTDNDLDCSIVPSSGTLKAFTTTEFFVTLAPDVKDLSDCSLLVRSIPNEFADKEEAKWNCTAVQIKPVPYKAPLLKIRLQSKGIVNSNAEQFQCPRCAQGNQSKSNESEDFCSDCGSLFRLRHGSLLLDVRDGKIDFECESTL